jgi:tRNA threonylcarbamoyladenosine biosynthesis protein TsaB
VIVLGIETSTPQTSVALGTETEILAQVSVAGKARQEAVSPAIEHLTRWAGVDLAQLGGVAVGIGPGLFTGLRVGVETAKTLAQVLGVPILGLSGLDALAFSVRHTSRTIVAVIDARRGEVFHARYLAAPGGVLRQGDYGVADPEHLVADLEATPEDLLVVGDGGLRYRGEIAELGARAEFASSTHSHPQAASLVELAVPRLLREEHDRLFEVVPLYLRKSDAEIAWDEGARGASA